jgi:hypothetical protein
MKSNNEMQDEVIAILLDINDRKTYIKPQRNSTLTLDSNR